MGLWLMLVVLRGASGRLASGPGITKTASYEDAIRSALVLGEGIALLQHSLHHPRVHGASGGSETIKTAVDFGLIRFGGVDQLGESAGFGSLPAAQRLQINPKAFGAVLKLGIGP